MRLGLCCSIARSSISSKLRTIQSYMTNVRSISIGRKFFEKKSSFFTPEGTCHFRATFVIFYKTLNFRGREKYNFY